MFRTFGRNALAAYILHGLVAGAVKPYVPNDVPGWYVASGFGVYFLITYLFIRYLERTGIYLPSYRGGALTFCLRFPSLP